MIVNSFDLLVNAKLNKKVIFQFNVNNLEWTKYILEEANSLNVPVILGFSESAISYMGGYFTVVSLIKALVKDLNIKTDVVIHLDHGRSYESCKEAIINGFTSVMYDGSKLSLEDNIKVTKDVVSLAKKYNVTVEGELGYVGTSISDVSYTKLEDAIYYVKETKIDSLAPAVGNVHGIYKSIPNIDFDLIKDLSLKTNVPLVLHGGSGLSNETFIKCVQNGVCKVNINTELQVGWTKKVREFLKNNQEVHDPRKIIGSGEDKIKETIRGYVNLFL